MINFYDSSVIDIKRSLLKKHRLLFYSVLVVAIAIEAVFCFIIEYKNKNIIQPLMIAIGILFSALLVFLYFYFIYPDKWMIKRYLLMNDSIKHEEVGTVEEIKENITLRRDIIGKEITFMHENNRFVLFLEDGETTFDFCVGKNYKVTTYDNFIVTVEENLDE